MTVAPPRRKSKAIFWIAVLAIGSAILATVLLANDMHHLKALAHRYDIAWFDTPPQKAGTASPPAAARAKPKPRPGIRPPDRFFQPAPLMQPASFRRRWKISGETLCAKFAEAGLAVGRWQPSGFDAGTFECSYETETPAATGAADAASLFVIVRGTAPGDIANVRFKVIIPDSEAGKAVQRTFLSALAVLFRECQWPDFQSSLDSIARLEDVTRTAFGAKLTFSHEFADPRRFNLILALDKPAPQDGRRTDFFDPAKWLPTPRTAAN